MKILKIIQFFILLLFGFSKEAFTINAQADAAQRYDFHYINRKDKTKTCSFNLYAQSQEAQANPKNGQLIKDFSKLVLDMKQINPGNPGEGYIYIALQEFEGAEDHKIVINPDWFTKSDQFALVHPQTLSEYKLIAGKPTSIKIIFKITGNGRVSIKVPLACIASDRNSRGVSRDYEAEFSAEVVNHISPCDSEWMRIANKGWSEWCAFVSKYDKDKSSCLEDALKAMEQEEAALYEQLKILTASQEQRDKLRAAVKRYEDCSKYPSKHATEIKQYLDKALADSASADSKSLPPPKKTPSKTLKETPACFNAWRALENTMDVQALYDFIEQYENDSQCGNPVAAAKRRVSMLEPLSCSIQFRDNVFSVFVANATAIRPRYKDVSAASGMNIYAPEFSETGRMQIKLDNPGLFQLYIRDALKRDTLLEFKNLFAAELLREKNTYEVVISGAQSPYRLQFLDLLSNKVAYEMQSTADTVIIHQDILDEKGLSGKYTLRVFSSIQEKPIIVQGGIVQPAQSNTLKWIALIGSMITLLALIIYLVSRLLRPKPQKTGNIYSIKNR